MLSDETLDSLVGWLRAEGIDFQENVDISRLSQIKAGGIFRLVVRPASPMQTALLVKQFAQRELPYKTLGNFSNVLFRDGLIRTVGVSSHNLREWSVTKDGVVTAGAGIMLPTLARKLVKAGYRGFAGLIGVPASLGGAVFMNASCYGDATSNFLRSVCCVSPSGELVEFQSSDLDFSWRHSAFHDRLSGYVIVSASFRLEFGVEGEEVSRETEIRRHRREYQETKFPNLGSTFATRAIYEEIAQRFPFYRLLHFVVRVLVRLFRGDRHHRYAQLARSLTKFYFRLSSRDGIDYSKSTFNCVVNLGGASANDLIDFVLTTKHALKNCVPLEIELQKDIE